MQNVIMGLDISTKTGLVVMGSAGDVEHHQVLMAPSGKDVNEGVDRAVALASEVSQLAHLYDVRLVVIEGYAYNKKYSQALTVELGTMVRYFLKIKGVPYIIVPPARLKQFVTGKGNSKKEVMLLNVFKSWAFETESHDIADAYGLARMGRYVMGFAPGLLLKEPKWRQKVVENVLSTCGLDKQSKCAKVR